jgi:hypothetical protein
MAKLDSVKIYNTAIMKCITDTAAVALRITNTALDIKKRLADMLGGYIEYHNSIWVGENKNIGSLLNDLTRSSYACNIYKDIITDKKIFKDKNIMDCKVVAAADAAEIKRLQDMKDYMNNTVNPEQQQREADALDIKKLHVKFDWVNYNLFTANLLQITKYMTNYNTALHTRLNNICADIINDAKTQTLAIHDKIAADLQIITTKYTHQADLNTGAAAIATGKGTVIAPNEVGNITQYGTDIKIRAQRLTVALAAGGSFFNARDIVDAKTIAGFQTAGAFDDKIQDYIRTYLRELKAVYAEQKTMLVNKLEAYKLYVESEIKYNTEAKKINEHDIIQLQAADVVLDIEYKNNDVTLAAGVAQRLQVLAAATQKYDAEKLNRNTLRKENADPATTPARRVLLGGPTGLVKLAEAATTAANVIKNNAYQVKDTLTAQEQTLAARQLLIGPERAAIAAEITQIQAIIAPYQVIIDAYTPVLPNTELKEETDIKADIRECDARIAAIDNALVVGPLPAVIQLTAAAASASGGSLRKNRTKKRIRGGFESTVKRNIIMLSKIIMFVLLIVVIILIMFLCYKLFRLSFKPRVCKNDFIYERNDYSYIE